MALAGLAGAATEAAGLLAAALEAGAEAAVLAVPDAAPPQAASTKPKLATSEADWIER